MKDIFKNKIVLDLKGYLIMPLGNGFDKKLVIFA